MIGMELRLSIALLLTAGAAGTVVWWLTTSVLLALVAGSHGDRFSPNTVQSVPGSSCHVSVPTAPASELTAVGADGAKIGVESRGQLDVLADDAAKHVRQT